MDKSPKPVANIAPFGLRMQPALREKVERAAEANARSLNQEIINRLEQSFATTLGADDDVVRSLLGALSRQDLLLKSSEAHLELVLTISLLISGSISQHALRLVDSGVSADKNLTTALEQIRNLIEFGYVDAAASNDAFNSLEKTIAKLTGRPAPEPIKNHNNHLLADSVAADLEKLGYKPKQIGSDPYAMAKEAQKIQDLQKSKP